MLKRTIFVILSSIIAQIQLYSGQQNKHGRRHNAGFFDSAKQVRPNRPRGFCNGFF